MAKTLEKVKLKKNSSTTIKVELPPWRRFLKGWDSVKEKAPDLKGSYQKVRQSIEGFWEDVDEDNPIKLPVSLGTGHVEGLQKQLDRLTLKARRKEAFDQKEKDFLVAVYRWIAAGGVSKWYLEATKLLWNYMKAVDAEDPLELNPYIYESSTIVQYAMSEMKKVMVGDVRKNGQIRNEGGIRSIGTVKNTHRTGTQLEELGNIIDNGILLTEQKNKRLKNADNRFALDAQAVLLADDPIRIRIRWSVTSKWDYESFAEQNARRTEHITELPLANGSRLRLHDGLSAYLVDLGLAKEFMYHAQWEETWLENA